MSNYRKTKRDTNHFEVMNAVEAAGFQVIDTAALGNNFPDFIACSEKATVLMEVKMPEGKLGLSQLKFLAMWRGLSAIVETAEEAIKVIRNPGLYALTEKDKHKILSLVNRRMQEYELMKYQGKKVDPYPRIRVTAFNKAMENL